MGDLEYKAEKDKKIEFKSLNYQEVRKEYQELLSLFDDDEFKEQIERRIADVYMIESGKDQLQAKPVKSYYDKAIKNYHKVLDKYPDSPDNADILYQLARAYDMDGRPENALKILLRLTTRHPNYKNNAEAHFRMGDIYFSQQKYRKAHTEYTIVSLMQHEKLSRYSFYMLGWTNYKHFNYEASVNSYAKVLSLLLDKNNKVESLSTTDKPLFDDTIQSMSLALAKNGGAAVIENISSLSNKPYLWRIYDSLGEYFLKKQRYEDSAETFRQYVQRYNFSAKAPYIHSKLIAAYIKGKFPVQALKEKEVYVEYYGLGSKYAKANGGPNVKIRKDLKVYYAELASHYHNRAQNFEKNYKKLTKSAKASQSKKARQFNRDSIESFERASYFYGRYIYTFPKDVRIPEMTFLKAEAHFATKKYPMAIQEFEKVAYQLKSYKKNKYRAKAGYAAIISYQKYIARLTRDGGEVKKWQAKAVESMLKFASVFHSDKRSPTVLTNAAEYMFSLDQYQRALEVANKLIKNKRLDRQLKKTAYGIAAHSYFQLKKYKLAEQSYLKQRALTKKGSVEYTKISERIATAIYKHSENLVAANQQKQAIVALLKIKKLSPEAKIRVDAQYNAAILLLATEQWKKAIAELKQLIAKFPNYKSAVEFPRKLALAYEKNKSWSKAASAYMALSKKDPDPKVRQDSLFIAAGMYEKKKDYATAITLFKQYARTYEKPFVVRMEARFRLAELYGKTKDVSRQLFWLRRIIDGDKKAGSLSNERSRWLAAWANATYGDYFASEFKRYKLRSLQSKKLAKKNSALKDAVKRYEMAANYGILEFVTMASVKTADLYLKFSKDLRRLPMPGGLTADDKKLFANIIDEQALPFENLSIELHTGNIERAWQGEYNSWIAKSFAIMRKLSPARFNKVEVEVSYGDEIR